MQPSAVSGQQSGKINKAQIRKIKTLQGRLKLDDEIYRLKLSDYWVRSCTDLSYDEAEQFISDLTREAMLRGVWNKPGKRWEHLGDRPGMASPAQLRLIEAMWAGVSYTHDRGKQQSALRKFIFRIVKVQAMEFVRGSHVNKLVTAMKHMKPTHKQTKREGERE